MIVATQPVDFAGDPLWLPEDMADLPKPEYSKREIVAAGKSIRLNLPEGTTEAPQAFRVAHAWRDSHVYPMMRVRAELSAKARAVRSGMVTGARLKRMQSIRRKLQDGPLTLYQLQDIGGCRVIVDSMEELNKLVTLYETRALYGTTRDDNYLERPKRGGYRSRHLIFNGRDGDDIYNRQFIEVQIRTKLQHAWATSVESVGSVRRENLKAGKGDPDWLRFFAVMSSEFAIEEGTPSVPGVPEDQGERRSELRALETKLGAIEKLDGYLHSIKVVDTFVGTDAKYFVMQYDRENSRVTVQSFNNFAQSSAAYIAEETKHPSRNTVLIEIDKVSDLKEAFPNYYLDVQMFNSRLKRIISGKDAPQISTTVRSRYDLGWLKDWMRRRGPTLRSGKPRGQGRSRRA